MSSESAAVLDWEAWPARQRPGLSAGVALLILGLSLGATLVYGSGWYGFITLMVLTGTLAPHFFPTRYCLDDAGVHWQRLTGRGQRPWSALRAWWDLGDRVLLGPGPRLSGWLARKRGVTLLLGGQREAVVAELTRRLGPPVSSPVGAQGES
jgi:hypothetical protein